MVSNEPTSSLAPCCPQDKAHALIPWSGFLRPGTSCLDLHVYIFLYLLQLTFLLLSLSRLTVSGSPTLLVHSWL